MNRSQIFTGYNKMRSNHSDTARLNRALGVAQLKQDRPYTTSASGCTCPDRTYRKVVCKHMLAAQITQVSAI